MRIVNLTPHVLNLFADDGELRASIAPSGIVARVQSTPGALVDYGLPVPVALPTVWGDVTDIPPPQDGVIYVASLFAAQLARRADVLSPGTGPNDNCIRDEQGRIAGVTRLIAHV